VEKSWLAMETQVITRDMAKLLGNPSLKGFRVVQVYPGTTTEAAGFKVGDLIVAVDGEPLEAAAPEDYEELSALVRQYKVGSKAEFSIIRGEEKQALTVELTASPRLAREMKSYEDVNFEFTVRDITFLDKVKEKWADDKAGALVTKLERGGWADIGGVNINDLIIRINDTPVSSSADVEKKMDELKTAKAKTAVFLVERGIYSAFLEIEPKWDSVPLGGKD
ncbi:MAG TPA: PDZ domain-containing protein, partial [Candidatus Hydrogenedentes bacterium]|nr:PDZ domain-containing protein [Candidatus Hydrogenedentota bacterium]